MESALKFEKEDHDFGLKLAGVIDKGEVSSDLSSLTDAEKLVVQMQQVALALAKEINNLGITPERYGLMNEERELVEKALEKIAA